MLFLSCKANARVQLAKKGHRPPFSQLGDNLYMVSSSFSLNNLGSNPRKPSNQVVICVILAVNCVVLCNVCV